MLFMCPLFARVYIAVAPIIFFKICFHFFIPEGKDKGVPNSQLLWFIKA